MLFIYFLIWELIIYLFSKSEISIINTLIIDLNLLIKFNNFSIFVVKYKEAWIEEGLLLVKQEYCKYGDLLDFLERFEKYNYNFNSDFYWDLIFQMFSVNNLVNFFLIFNNNSSFVNEFVIFKIFNL